uniref:Uncharacterized protein n=1 Tax=Ciona savignyi TaxID=51511 RepID=H2Z310_CIOSA
MNFFKKSKYTLSGGKSGGKASKQQQKNEQFQKLSGDSENQNKTQKAKVESCFAVINSTPFVWNLEPTGNQEFPKLIPAHEKRLVQFDGTKSEASAKYSIKMDNDSDETHHVALTAKRTDKKWFLKIDWGNLASVDGISLKPDQTGSDDGIHFENEEATSLVVEVTYNK